MTNEPYEVQVSTWPEITGVQIIDLSQEAVIADYRLDDKPESHLNNPVFNLLAPRALRINAALRTLERDCQDLLQLHTNQDTKVRLRHDPLREESLNQVLAKHDLKFSDIDYNNLRMFALKYLEMPIEKRWELLLDWWDVADRHLSMGSASINRGTWVNLAAPNNQTYYQNLVQGDIYLAKEAFEEEIKTPTSEWGFYLFLRWLYLSSTEFKDFPLQWPHALTEGETYD